MGIVAKVGEALQRLFSEIAKSVGQANDVIQRKRKFDEQSLAATFVLGFLQDPEANDETLAHMATHCGVTVTPQAINQRYTPKLMKFFEVLFGKATQVAIGSTKSLAPILERFTNVTMLDSSTVVLPDEMQEGFRGCGGGKGGGAAALKLQVELDLRSGALSHVEIESGRSPDSATSRQHVRRGPGSLRITDLGYFNASVFAAMMAAGEHFLSRLLFGTQVMLCDGTEIGLAWLEKHLAKQPGPFVDLQILLGKGQKLPCRMIAWRLPTEQANRRRQKLRQDIRSERGQEPSAERLAWCDWTILVTSVPLEMMTPAEAVVLYRARWQIELLFKRWKSQDLVAVLTGSTAVRQMVRVWSRLLAALLQHWLVIASVWGDPTKSLSKVCEAIRSFVTRLAAGLHHLTELQRTLEDMCRAFASTCRRNRRARPGTFELLNDVSLLAFDLT